VNIDILQYNNLCLQLKKRYRFVEDFVQNQNDRFSGCLRLRSYDGMPDECLAIYKPNVRVGI
jgi:hypothetical protein